MTILKLQTWIFFFFNELPNYGDTIKWIEKVNCEGIYYKMDWLWNLEKWTFHSFCSDREAYSPIHWNDVPAHQNTQSSAIIPSDVHEWVTVSIKISWTYFVFIYQMQEIYILGKSYMLFVAVYYLKKWSFFCDLREWLEWENACRWMEDNFIH